MEVVGEKSQATARQRHGQKEQEPLAGLQGPTRPMNVDAMRPSPVAKPSIPSRKFTALVMPILQKMVRSTSKPSPRKEAGMKFPLTP
jgi:hypothetical protein